MTRERLLHNYYTCTDIDIDIDKYRHTHTHTHVHADPRSWEAKEVEAASKATVLEARVRVLHSATPIRIIYSVDVNP
jgi:hypothetical protein